MGSRASGRAGASQRRHEENGSRRISAKQLARILNSVPHVIWASGPEGKLDFVSEQWTRLYGGETSQLIGDGWIAFVHPDDRDAALQNWSDALGKGEPYQTRFRLRTPAAEYRWVLVTATPSLRNQGSGFRWLGTCTDIHDLVTAQNALDEKQHLYRSVLEASADCIKILSLEGRLQLMNAPGIKLMGLSDFAEVENCYWWELWPAEMQESVRASLQKAVAGETVRFSGPCPSASGQPKWWDVVVTPIMAGSNVTGVLSISRDSTAERQKSEELEWASEHDALTGLPNRRAFQSRLQAAVLRAMHDGSNVGLLLVDLDHFKHVNDTLGHAAGDEMLKQFARRLKAGMKGEAFVARVGGDEFAIVIEDLACAYDLLSAGDQATASLSGPLRLQGRALSGGASIGGALFPHDAESANELFKVADTALYALKAEGRGGTKLFHAYMREEAQRVASQLSLARIAVNEGSVCPSYQPKVWLADEKVAGYEALLRWNHPSKGVQLPDTIEEAFKDYELASKIGALMQRKVLSDIRSWTSKNVDFGTVSINAAPAEFLRDDYAELLLDRLKEYGIAPALVELEITEHVLMASGSKYVRRALTELKAAGVTIALDDFGTGYSSLSHLRDFPVDIVKIDKSFVGRMTADCEIASIVSGVINLAKSLRIISVAEGVEHPAQADMLRLAGCDMAQGYLFGRARPAECVSARAAARAA